MSEVGVTSTPEEDVAFFMSQSVEEADPVEFFEEEERKSFRSLPPANIIVAGRPGIGKSTLINALFRRELAATGKGKPVTKRVRKYTEAGVPVALYDTPGIELGKQVEDVIEDYVKIIDDNVLSEPDRIHLMWYCVLTDNGRIEDYEEAIIAAIAERVPVILVMTKVLGDDDEDALDFEQELVDLRLPVVDGRPIKTLAQLRKVRKDLIEPFGLDTLVDTTYRVLPEAVKRAFVNAQQVSIPLKASEARKKVLPWATAAAAGIGASPIPVPDAGPLLALQLAMMARIQAVMGVELDKTTQRYLMKGFVASQGMAAVGRAAASFFLKFVPGAGNAINASVAGALTAALGEAYIRTCVELLKARATGKDLPDSDLLEFLVDQFRNIYKS